MTIKQKTVVIIGGGFAGLNLAKALVRKKTFNLILVDRNNYNYFTPLVYQVATGFLEPSSISYPFRKIFHNRKNFRFIMGNFIGFDAIKNLCYLDTAILEYDYLVFAIGAVPNYFNNENVFRNAISMKSLDDALLMRNRILQTMEAACRETDSVLKKSMLTFVVAGAGPTGVEVSGMLAEMRRRIFQRDYPELEDDNVEIILIDGTPVVLNQMSAQSQTSAQKRLESLGVKLKLNSFVVDYSGNKVTLSDGEIIKTASLIWTAGVTIVSVHGLSTDATGKGNRILTDGFHRVKSFQNVFAIGDVALNNQHSKYQTGHPQLAQPAIQQGKWLARYLIRLGNGKSFSSFRYKDRGSLAIVGRHFAVADLFASGYFVGGFPALLVWLFVHLAGLVSWGNRFKTFLNWLGAYAARDLSLRLIFRPSQDKK